MSKLDQLNEQKILESWTSNATPWITAVRERQIESRRLVTDQAILDAVLEFKPKTLLDIGCGEGWLVRRLAEHHVRCTGIDTQPILYDAAIREGGGDFRKMSYQDIAEGKLDVKVDMIVSNFSLFGNESVRQLIKAFPDLLRSSGKLLIQTLHPHRTYGEYPYQNGWQENRWDGCGANFLDALPWYFRTLESWLDLIISSGFKFSALREPLHPDNNQPASVIFIAELP